MGTSSPLGKIEIKNWVSENLDEIDNILDIGAGSGTYFKLLDPLKKFNWSAVEVWQPYIEKFKLNKTYQKVYNIDIRQFVWNTKFDLTIAGDVLEHITKAEAVNVVHNCLLNSKYLIISIPIIHYPQEEINNNPYEYHVKDDWSHDEVLTTWGNNIIKFEITDVIGVYWLSL